MKNPDEFYFAMHRKKTKEGVHLLDGAESLPHDVVQVRNAQSCCRRRISQYSSRHKHVCCFVLFCAVFVFDAMFGRILFAARLGAKHGRRLAWASSWLASAFALVSSYVPLRVRHGTYNIYLACACFFSALKLTDVEDAGSGVRLDSSVRGRATSGQAPRILAHARRGAAQQAHRFL